MNYKDTATFVKTSSSGYAGSRTVVSQEDVSCFFIQNSGVSHGSFEEEKKSDATCYPNPTNSFISDNLDSLEGIYIVFDDIWYKIVSYSINKDILRANKIDNIEIKLNRVTPVAQIS
jgi:hypothetical protein